jgi:hypothetical protein
MASALMLLVPAAALTAPQEKTGEPAATAHAARPGQAEMERLKFYLGEWEYTETYPKSAFYPNGGENTGIYTCRLGPGGNSLINTFHSHGPVGDFEGLLILTWDLKEKAYKEYVFGDGFPGAVVQTGAFEGDTLVFRSDLDGGGQTMKLRNVTRLTAAGTLESEQYMSVKDAPASLLVRVVASRKR